MRSGNARVYDLETNYWGFSLPGQSEAAVLRPIAVSSTFDGRWWRASIGSAPEGILPNTICQVQGH